MNEAETRAEHIDPAHAGATVFMSTHLLNTAELRQLQGHGQLEQIFLSLL